MITVFGENSLLDIKPHLLELRNYRKKMTEEIQSWKLNVRFPLNFLLELLMLERYRSYLGSQKWGKKTPRVSEWKAPQAKMFWL